MNKEKEMKCKCGKPMVKVMKEEHFSKDGKSLIIRNVPVYRCFNCKKDFYEYITKRKIKIIKYHFKCSILNGFIRDRIIVRYFNGILKM